MEEQAKNKKKNLKEAEDIKVNPLRNEKIYVRFVPHEGGLAGTDHKHPLYGGRANGTKTVIRLPILDSTGKYKNALTKDEKAFLERALSLDDNALSIYNTKDNFWDNFKVVLDAKEGLRLDLSNPEDYIRYKVLLANSDIIAPSVQERLERPKRTYQYEIVSERNEAFSEDAKVDAFLDGAKELGKIEDDIDTMRVLAEVLDSKPYAQNTSRAFLRTRLAMILKQDSKTFYKAIKDPLLHTKVLLRRGQELGKISRKADNFYLAADGTPLCNDNENPTFSIAARYLNEPAHQELKFLLESEVEKAKIK